MDGKTWLEQGVEIGEVRGQRKLLLKLIEHRFGTLGDSARQRLQDWPAEKLTDLGCAWLTAQSLSELGLEG